MANSKFSNIRIEDLFDEKGKLKPYEDVATTGLTKEEWEEGLRFIEKIAQALR